jgi:hypothetical protein
MGGDEKSFAAQNRGYTSRAEPRNVCKLLVKPLLLLTRTQVPVGEIAD